MFEIVVNAPTVVAALVIVAAFFGAYRVTKIVFGKPGSFNITIAK